MADRGDELEGWGVRWRVAVVGAVLSFAFIAVSLAVLHAFWRLERSPQVQTWPRATFPSPRLNAKLDSDVAWSFAPPSPFERPAPPVVRAAMAAVAAQGNAIDGPPANSVAAMSPTPVARSGPGAAAAGANAVANAGRAP